VKKLMTMHLTQRNTLNRITREGSGGKTTNPQAALRAGQEVLCLPFVPTSSYASHCSDAIGESCRSPRKKHVCQDLFRSTNNPSLTCHADPVLILFYSSAWSLFIRR
jgi:hypothetical protein